MSKIVYWSKLYRRLFLKTSKSLSINEKMKNNYISLCVCTPTCAHTRGWCSEDHIYKIWKKL